MRKTDLITDDELMDACSLLSSMYLCTPDGETLGKWRELLSGENHAVLSDLRNALFDVDMEANDEVENLLWEYTRLFIGPYKLPCPPWESVYTSPKKLLMQEAYDDVRNYYRNAGLTVNSQDIMPDHIGAELNFLAVLLQKAKDSPEEGLYYRGLAKSFLDEHLMKWSARFARDMEAASESELYKTLARTTRHLVDLFGG
jgi:TorA maturation chaperone TorD